MHILSQWANRILNLCEQSKLIVSPTKKLLLMMLAFYALASILLIFVLTPWVIVALPILGFVAYFYYFFCKIWRAYRYSGFYLVFFPLLALGTALGVHQWIL